MQHASRFCFVDERSLDCVRHNTVIVAYHLDKCAIVIEAHFQPKEKRASTKRQSAVNVLLALTLCEIDRAGTEMHASIALACIIHEGPDSTAKGRDRRRNGSRTSPPASGAGV